MSKDLSERMLPATVTPEGYILWLDPILGPWLCATTEVEVQELVEFDPRYHFFFGEYRDDFRYESVSKEKR